VTDVVDERTRFVLDYDSGCSNSFNFNFGEKCYLHARYLLLPTCPTAHD
jgi:hypothetical protein